MKQETVFRVTGYIVGKGVPLEVYFFDLKAALDQYDTAVALGKAEGNFTSIVLVVHLLTDEVTAIDLLNRTKFSTVAITLEEWSSRG